MHKFYVSLLSAVELGEWSWMHIIENQSSNLQHFICPHCRGFLPNVFGLYSAECGIVLFHKMLNVLSAFFISSLCSVEHSVTCVNLSKHCHFCLIIYCGFMSTTYVLSTGAGTCAINVIPYLVGKERYKFCKSLFKGYYNLCYIVLLT